VDGRAVAAQQSLADAIEIDHDRGDRIAFGGALRDRLTHQFVGERGRQLLGRDDPLRLRSRAGDHQHQRDALQPGGNLQHLLSSR
jgi:hypothetical protein